MVQGCSGSLRGRRARTVVFHDDLRCGVAVREPRHLADDAFGDLICKLVADSAGTTPFVTPVLCFSRATFSCYGPVGGVEVVGVGSLNRTIANRPARYSPQEARTISRFLEKRLGVGPAAGPGLPPEGPSGARRALDTSENLPSTRLGE